MTKMNSENGLRSRRLDAEPIKAFRAYCVYRDLGPGRSLKAAWSAHCAPEQSKEKSRGRPRIDSRATQCSGQWTEWSRQFRWAERAAASDDCRNVEQWEAHRINEEKLEDMRRKLELEEQDRLERHVRKLDAVIYLAIAAPVTETIVTTKVGREKTTRSTGRPINFRALASLIKARNETARAAIVGARPEAISVQLLPTEWGRVHRVPGESGRAYDAFWTYCQLGPKRSLDAAWRKHLNNLEKPSAGARCPGRWSLWSAAFRWVERAGFYDESMRAARLRRISHLQERRFDFEIANQQLLEDLVDKIEGVLDKADTAPVGAWTIWSTANGVRTKIEYKTYSVSGYANLMRLADNVASLILLGWGKNGKEAPSTQYRNMSGEETLAHS